MAVGGGGSDRFLLASANHFSGRNRRRATGTGTSPRAKLRETSDWQLAFLQSAPLYWRATPTEHVPFFRRGVSSITRQATDPQTSWFAEWANSVRSRLSSQAGLAMKCGSWS